MKAIGIDPDATGFVCAELGGEDNRVVTRRFGVSVEGLREFVRWVEQEDPGIVAIEGLHGQSGPIEGALRKAGRVFYSFRPVDTDKYRRAVLGENKNNERDAEAVARFALSLHDQGRLQRCSRAWEPDADLRLISRRHRSVSKQMTAETNRLWKHLRQASPDLYLLLGGQLRGVDSPPKMLRNEGILTLLAGKPQIGEWRELSEEQLMEAMGGGEYKGRRTFVRQLRAVASSFPALSPAMCMVIRASAQQLRGFKGEIGDLQGMLDELGEERPAVQRLMQMPGIGTITATGLVAEIIDIRRFPSEDHLASYSGLGRVEHSSGPQQNTKAAQKYSRRLKDLLMTAAIHVVHSDPNSHLAGFHRNLIKKGMQPLEAAKRAARALVRVIYRELMALVQPPNPEQGKGQGDVASGRSRGDKVHLSNTPPRSQSTSRVRSAKRVKGEPKRRKLADTTATLPGGQSRRTA